MKEQEFLDLLFEEPETYLGLRNKLRWAMSQMNEMSLKSHYLPLTNTIIRETKKKLDKLCQSLT